MELIYQIRESSTKQIERTATLPDGVRLDFDAANDLVTPTEPNEEAIVRCGNVQKTSQRTIVSLQDGCFQAREVVRQHARHAGTTLQRSTRLSGLVPKGSRYAFDLIAYVGVESYLRGHSLQDIRQDLARHQPAINIPTSTLWEQQQKFLFFLGHLHEQAMPVLRQYLAEHSPVIWLLDGTIEPGTPVFLGIQDAVSGILLSSRKIPSENEDDITCCLQEAATCYGLPDRVLHDLSGTMSGACDRALDGVPHFVCHYHLASDVGEDLYKKPQVMLSKRMRALKVQFRLREQRRGQKEWLQQRLDSPAQLMLQKLLAGREVDSLFSETLGREVLLAFHYWILDYRADGRRRGFPFDPYTLYLHRRLVRAGEAVDRLLSRPAVSRQAPRVLCNFQKQLKQYRMDTEIVEAADLYERAFAMFTRLREALRLTADNMHNLRQLDHLPGAQQQDIKTELHTLRAQLRLQSQHESDPNRQLAEIVLVHLDRYWSHLIPDWSLPEDGCWERTTCQLERYWRVTKRARRLTHGRGKLTRDFQALPEEYMIVPNLENVTYVQLVLDGSLDTLPSRLAEAGRQAGSFSAWQRRRRPELLGQIPRRLIRDDAFIDQLIVASESHCQTSHHAA